MKYKTLICIVLNILFASGSLFAQEFEYDLIFLDHEGNSDTITFGYDELGTELLDAEFDEINIIDVPYKEGLDVRITDEWVNRTNLNLPGTFHTKKQITKKNDPWGGLSNVDIITKNWPVFIHWDNSLFIAEITKDIFITSINPGGWWDTDSPSDMGLIVFESTIPDFFTSNYQPPLNTFNFAYINDNNDTIPTYWHYIPDSSFYFFWTSIQEINNIRNLRAYPNPTSGKFIIESNIPNDYFEYINVYDLSGEFIIQKRIQNRYVDISDLSSGLYILKLYNIKGDIEILRIVKE